MDYPTNGPGNSAGSANGAPKNMNETDAVEKMRGYAEDATASINDVVAKGREMILRYPVLSVAGVVAAGYLFAKFVARRR